jgi:hypothetical protein
MALKIQWIDLSRKLKNGFSQGFSQPNFSFEGLLSSSKSRGQAGALGDSTDGSRGADDKKDRSRFRPNEDVYQVSSKNIDSKCLKSGGQKRLKGPLLDMPV